MNRCFKCGAEIFDPTKPCPQCGFKPNLVPEWVLWADIVLFVLSLVAFFSTNSPLMIGVAFSTFLYMIYDLGRRNSQQMAIKAAQTEPGPEAPVVPEAAQEEPEPAPEESKEQDPAPTEPVEKVCEFCGEALEEGAKYCGHCGRRQDR